MVLMLQGGNFGSCRSRRLSAVGADAKTRKPGPQALGQREGAVHEQGPVQLGDRARDEVARPGSVQRNADVVKRGVVQVRDFRKHKTVNVRAGRSYLAAAP